MFGGDVWRGGVQDDVAVPTGGDGEAVAEAGKYEDAFQFVVAVGAPAGDA